MVPLCCGNAATTRKHVPGKHGCIEADMDASIICQANVDVLSRVLADPASTRTVSHCVQN
eukprot:scaffold277108_cov19-Tisochrysis_lutea.AAC.1